MDGVIPEVVTLAGAPLVAFIVGGIKQALGSHGARFLILLTMAVGVVVAGLIYVAGFVEIDGLTTAQYVARIVIAGIALALAASGARSWVNAEGEERRRNNDPEDPQ